MSANKKSSGKKKAKITTVNGSSSPEAATATVRILTLNLKLLPGLVAVADGARDGCSRIESLVESIDGEFDVLCFQEVFDDTVRDLLATLLQPKFEHQVAKSYATRNPLRQDSGLFFASRFPLDGAVRFARFDDTRGSDAWAEKGVLGVRLDLGHGRKLIVFNLHLQSDSGWVGENEAVRRNQLEQVRDFVRNALSWSGGLDRTSVLVVGDFNVEGDSAEYLRMCRVLEYPVDLFRRLHPDPRQEPGFTWDGSDNLMIPRNDQDRLRLDYLLALQRVPVGAEDIDNRMSVPTCESCELLRTGSSSAERLSDHHGVRATLRLS